jgi:diaminopimelate epimerase
VSSLPFHKMSGAGNDFIIIDNRAGIVAIDDLPGFAAKVCRRKMSVGADGLFLVEKSDTADFRWQFFNADGSVPEMCGNGARCAARFAFLMGMTGRELSFETLAGIIHASVEGERVKIKMTAPHDMRLNRTLALASGNIPYSFINTGVPHVVVEAPDVEPVDVAGLGRQIRQHADFAPDGSNVNFVAPLPGGAFAIRTYERGVEDETLACGTGNVAAALILAARHGSLSPVILHTRSGSLLKVYFEPSATGQWQTVYLEGDARVIYAGEMNEAAWNY